MNFHLTLSLLYGIASGGVGEAHIPRFVKSILKNQTIRIDNHQRGGVPMRWDDESQDIHLHKSQNSDKKQQQYEIRIPLNSNRKITINNEAKPIPSKIKKEINKAFKSPSKKSKFINALKGALKDCKWNEKDAPEVAKKIALVFGFSEEELINENSPFCLRLINQTQSKYQVFVNNKKEFIIIGEFQPFSANGLRKTSRNLWNEFLFKNIGAILDCKTLDDLKLFLKDSIKRNSGIGIKTLEDTIAHIQSLYEIFS